eukprot:CAMPEP_0206470790 /NCGR_PEP_ID=MMETSP0324_2-20121206/31153_1 /ASSEMBLY_ACC=CAM_ASM_000836 /TAXON_ID=2866 /ORGANISM="Crypthecodinium cohnii, Strain Seligo" /LENGTH=51 /DNA_ID=CAMNT_0053944943 /DNA_START=253 /DNA_END=405 /DNA_ORIENTATION=-
MAKVVVLVLATVGGDGGGCRGGGVPLRSLQSRPAACRLPSNRQQPAAGLGF